MTRYGLKASANRPQAPACIFSWEDPDPGIKDLAHRCQGREEGHPLPHECACGEIWPNRAVRR